MLKICSLIFGESDFIPEELHGSNLTLACLRHVGSCNGREAKQRAAQLIGR